LLQSLKFSLSFSLIKVVLTLGEELLLGHVEELLVRQAELALHLSHLPSQVVILLLNGGEIL
jgi:hypothetical protein